MPCFSVYQGIAESGDLQETAVIKLDGSAQFAGTVKQGNFNGGQTDTTGSVFINEGGIATQYAQSVTASTARGLRIYHGASENVTIYADGTASFAGTMYTGEWTPGQSNQPGSEQYGNYIYALGGYFANRINDDSTVLKGYKQGTLNVDITANGSATFQDNVEAAYFSGNQDSGDSAVFRGRVGTPGATEGGYTSVIYANGSAVLGNTSLSVSDGFNLFKRLSTGTDSIIETRDSNDTILLQARANGVLDVRGAVNANGITFNLEPDDDSNYVTTTTSDGGIDRVYNGPTLDVKAELQKKNTALAAIKTAAEDASITTLSDFKLAIVAALANI